MDFKFIHVADIHLDSPLLGLERYEGAPVKFVRGAVRKALQNLVELALQEKVHFILIAGDLYDGNWRDYHTGLFFVSQMAKLREGGIKVYLIRGNHDAASQLTRRLRLPDNVKDFATDKPETVLLDELGVAVHGQGFPTPAVSEDLARRYPGPLPGYFNIGLLHTCATGREGHENYAPCDIAYLANKGYAYWALGHVHQREVLGEDPWIVFPGNIQGRQIRERGAKGCTLVQVRGGKVEKVEHRSLDLLRWSLCRIDAGGAGTYDQVLERAKAALDRELGQSEGRLLALRLEIYGSCEAHSQLVGDRLRLNNELRAMALERGLDSVWVEKVKIGTAPPGRAEKLFADSPVAALLQYIREFGNNEELLRELARELERDHNALPAELFADGEPAPGNLEYLRGLLPEVEELLLSRLWQKEVLKGENQAP